MTKPDQQERSRRLLATIHVARKELGLDEDTYRGILRDHFAVESAGDLSTAHLVKLVDYFTQRGFVVRSRRGVKRPKNMNRGQSRARLLEKIEALLTVGGKPWAYADGIARRMYRVDKVQWLLPAQLTGIVAALVKQGEREGWAIRR